MIKIDSKHRLDLSKLHKNQQKFVRDSTLHCGIVGGYQSGKSSAASVKVITKLLIDPGVPIAYYLPNYRLISDMLVPKFRSLFESIDTPMSHNSKESKIITPYGEIWMRSMDNPSAIISYSVGYSIVDEADLVHKNKRKEAMKRIVSRNSYKKSTPNSIDYVSTPEGFGYMYDFFVKNHNDRKRLYKLSTLANESNLGSGYVDGLREHHTETQLKAYLHGDFVNLTSGTVYHTFDRKRNHSDRTIKEGEPLHVGMDFNITNMSAVIHVTDGSKVTAVSEITKAYDTAEMIEVIKDRFVKHKIVVYPDASGQSRKTSASDTDVALLRKAGFMVRVDKSNPSVRDRVTKHNAGFLNANGETEYYVNTNDCPEYTECLEQLAYKNGVPDKDNGFDHLPEAGGYCFYKIKKGRLKTRTSNVFD